MILEQDWLRSESLLQSQQPIPQFAVVLKPWSFPFAFYSADCAIAICGLCHILRQFNLSYFVQSIVCVIAMWGLKTNRNYTEMLKAVFICLISAAVKRLTTSNKRPT